jgi:hypothetical protein
MMWKEVAVAHFHILYLFVLALRGWKTLRNASVNTENLRAQI